MWNEANENNGTNIRSCEDGRIRGKHSIYQKLSSATVFPVTEG